MIPVDRRIKFAVVGCGYNNVVYTGIPDWERDFYGEIIAVFAGSTFNYNVYGDNLLIRPVLLRSPDGIVVPAGRVELMDGQSTTTPDTGNCLGYALTDGEY